MKPMKLLLLSTFLCLAHFICFCQNREDLPLYHAEQQRKQQILSFLSSQLQKHEGMQMHYDSLQKITVQDSIKRYTLLRKPKVLQYGTRKNYRN